MIGGNGVDGAIEEAFDHCGAVGLCAEGRVHLRVRVVMADALFSEREVVRGDLAGDVEALFACGTDRVERLFRGEMRDVEVRVGNLAHESDVALDEAGLGFDRHAAQTETKRKSARIHRAATREARVFGVLDHGKILLGCGSQRPGA
jgi:hypothetical protein